MNWITLEQEEQIEQIRVLSGSKAQVIFKHSTRCSISSVVKNRLDKSEGLPGIDFYYLDLIRYRNISDKVSTDFFVEHESPQILLIRNGECVYDESHSAITMAEIEEQAAK